MNRRALPICLIVCTSLVANANAANSLAAHAEAPLNPHSVILAEARSPSEALAKPHVLTTATPGSSSELPPKSQPAAPPDAPLSPEGASLCFDFATASGIKPLSAPIPFSSPARLDTTTSGLNPQGGGWGAARALLEIPISTTLRLLRNQTTLKDPKASDLEISHATRPGLVDLQNIDITIHPFPLISIHWTEQWAYRITDGTKDQPREVLIAYQKTSGTSHIRHFCGNIWLKVETPTQTDFAVYEETDATHREATDIAQGHLGTLRTLRAKAAGAK